MPLERLEFKKLREDFLELMEEEGKSINTVKNYRTDLDCFYHYWLDQTSNEHIDQLDLPQVLEYGSYLERRYQSDNSRRRRVQSLRIFFDFLVSHQYFKSNPVRKIATSPKFLDRPRPTKFEEVRSLWALLNHDLRGKSDLERLSSMRNQLIFLFIFGSGLKVSELHKLKWQQLVLSEKPVIVLHPPKRDSYSVPLLPHTVEILRGYEKLLSSEKKRSHQNFDEVLFNANAHRILSGGLSSRGLELLFKNWSNELGIEMTPKNLRLACVFRWMHEKHPDGLIKEWMGVAPSYQMKGLKEEKNNYIYQLGFLSETT